MEPYAYVGGNPETKTDPTGHRIVGENGDWANITPNGDIWTFQKLPWYFYSPSLPYRGQANMDHYTTKEAREPNPNVPPPPKDAVGVILPVIALLASVPTVGGDTHCCYTGNGSQFAGQHSFAGLLAIIPANATFKAFTGRTGQGFTFSWSAIGPDGLLYTYQLRIHGPDPKAPVGSNAADNWIYRFQRTGGTVPGNNALAEATHFQTTAPTWEDLQYMYQYLGGDGVPLGGDGDGGSVPLEP